MKVAGRGWERHAGTLCPYFVARPRGVTDSLQEARPRLPLEAAPTAHECRPQAHPHQETRHYRAPASHLHVLITTSAPGVVDETATRFIGSNVENSDARDSIVAAICGDWHLLRRIANQTVGLSGARVLLVMVVVVVVVATPRPPRLAPLPPIRAPRLATPFPFLRHLIIIIFLPRLQRSRERSSTV
jgi:hypothetical protein